MDLFVFLFFVFGLIFGSFANVLILRESFLRAGKGRSHCVSCKHPLGFFDLFPIVSFLFLKGRCRYCKKNISFQYPLIEFLVGLLFALAYSISSGFFESVLLAFLFFFSLVLIVCDIRQKAVPQEYIYPLYALCFVWFFVFSFSLDTLLYALVFAAPFLFLAIVSRERWMGYGDGIVAFPLGLLLSGYGGALLSFFLTFWLGFLFFIGRSVVYLFLKKKVYTKREAIALLPFLILSLFIVFVFDLDLFAFLYMVRV